MKARCPECGRTIVVRPLRCVGDEVAFPVHFIRGARCAGSRWLVEDEDVAA